MIQVDDLQYRSSGNISRECVAQRAVRLCNRAKIIPFGSTSFNSLAREVFLDIRWQCHSGGGGGGGGQKMLKMTVVMNRSLITSNGLNPFVHTLLQCGASLMNSCLSTHSGTQISDIDYMHPCRACIHPGIGSVTFYFFYLRASHKRRQK